MAETESSTQELPSSGLELTSTLTDDGNVTLAVGRVDLASPGEDQVTVRVEAAPINPSDLVLLFAMADLESAEATGTDELPAVSAPVSPRVLAAMKARLGIAMPAGNEGAGTIVAAGPSDAPQGLLGRVVGFFSGNSYAQYRTLHISQCLPMAEGTTAADAAAAFVNPLTALGMVETMRSEGHSALVHTVGASNLGQMLNRLCLDDGVDLVNIVRKPEHAEQVRATGAQHVCDSSADSFIDNLTEALRATGATIAFDAIGGGEMASTLLARMEVVASESGQFGAYGSDTLKQIYVYGGLDRGPTTLRRDYGMSWAVGGWLLTPFLMKTDPEVVEGLRQRVADEITTTFASSYGVHLSLADAVDPDHVRRYGAISTGAKALITPHA